MHYNGFKFLPIFKISNEFGAVQWENIDISGVKIDEIVEIKQGSVDIGPNNLFKNNINHKMNKQVFVTLNKIKLNYNEKQIKLVQKLGQKGKESNILQI